MSRFLANISVKRHIGGRTATRGGRMTKTRDWMKAPRRSHVDKEKLLRMMARSAVVAILGGASDVTDGKKGRKRIGRYFECYLLFCGRVWWFK